MLQWIISSSVLIAVILLLRLLLKGRISLRLQYGLWALVLLRLLIPGSILHSAASVANLVSEFTEPPVFSAPALKQEEALEEKRKAEASARKAEEEARLAKRKEAEAARKALQAKMQERQNAGLCRHCGGEFKGLFSKKCTACGKLKDY